MNYYYDYDDGDPSSMTATQLHYLGLLNPDDAEQYRHGFNALKHKYRRKSLHHDAEELAEFLGNQAGQILRLRDTVGTLTRLLTGHDPARDRLNELQTQRESVRDELHRVRQLRNTNQGINQLAGQFGVKSLDTAPTDLEGDLAAREAALDWQLVNIGAELCREYGICGT